MSSLIQYESMVDDVLQLYLDRTEQLYAKSGTICDFSIWLQYYAFDVIGMITYGKRLGFLDRGEDVGNVISALDDHLGYASLVGIFPSLHQYMFPLKNYFAGSRGSGRAYVDGL